MSDLYADRSSSNALTFRINENLKHLQRYIISSSTTHTHRRAAISRELGAGQTGSEPPHLHLFQSDEAQKTHLAPLEVGAPRSPGAAHSGRRSHGTSDK